MNNRHYFQNNFIRTVIIFLIASVLAVIYTSPVCAAPGPSAEEVQNTQGASGVTNGAFEVTEYELSGVINKDHSYEVTEKVSVNIPEQIQNLELAIPSGNFRISDLEVENTSYSSNKAREASTVTIVDSDKLSPGSHSYTIKYTIREFEDRDSSKDIFYFNALLPEWKQPIGKVSINLSFPEDFPWDDMQCYAGQFGVQDGSNRAMFESDEKSKTVSVKGEKIPENFGITLKAELPDGYWSGALNGSWVIPAVYCIMAGILTVLLVLWIVGGRDPRSAKTKETKPIEGVHPSELGYIFNGEVSIRDMLQLLIYFGRKGYLTISEYEPKQYRVYRKEEPTGEEKLYRSAYGVLFEDIYKDRPVEMEHLGERVCRMQEAIRDDIAAGYSSANSLPFTPLSLIFRYISGALLATGIGASNALTYCYEYLDINYAESVVLACVFVAAIFALINAIDKRESAVDDSNVLVEIASAILILGVIIYVSFAILNRIQYNILALFFAFAAMLSVLFVVAMRARGKHNAELVTRIRQLRNFIYHPTPKELLENHLANDDYYYDMLQYALSSGGEESWAMSFLTLDVPEPAWFSDDIEGHAYSNIMSEMSTMDYAKDIKTFMRTIEIEAMEYQRRYRIK